MARDQRLESFAQGGQGDRGRPSAWLAVQAAGVSSPEVLADATPDELLGVGRAWKSLEGWTFTGKLAVVRELIRRYPRSEDEGAEALAAGGLPDEWDPRLHHEVAAALGISVVAAAKLVNLAWTLDSRLAGISKALDDGLLDPGKVRMIVDETCVLETGNLFARAEEIILAGLGKCRTWADLVRLVQRAVITVDPDGAEKRRERAEREEARLKVWRETSGTCGLQVTGLPTDEALAAQAHIEARALEYKAARIRRPLEGLRVMAFADILNGVPAAQRIAWEQARGEEARRAGTDDETDDQAARDARLRETTRQAKEKFHEEAALPPPPHNARNEEICITSTRSRSARAA